MPVVHYTIDRDLHRRAKIAAATLDLTFKEFLEQALDEKAQKVEARQARKKPPS